MNRRTAYEGRKLPGLPSHFITSTILSGTSFTPKLILSISLLVITAFLCSCDKQQPIYDTEVVKISTKWIPIECKSSHYTIRTASVLTFRSDSLGRLDSYQYIEDIKDNKVWIASTAGSRISYIYANLNIGKENMARISTSADLNKFHCNLEDAEAATPFMIGLCETDEKGRYSQSVYMKPMVSEIILNSISCNFSGTPYEGEKITDPQIYLINVNAQCSLDESHSQVQRLVNVGACNQNDIEQFSDPGIIRQFIGQDIGEKGISTCISLYCFHNFSKEEGPGTPFTRLVLEGKIQGETYYWPITINRMSEGEGVRNNTRHIFDLTIRRKGSTNPDEELSIVDCNMTMEWKEWDEKEEYIITF